MAGVIRSNFNLKALILLFSLMIIMMLCSSLPYPIMTPQIDDIIKDAPYSFKDNKLVREFLSKARENMKLIEEHQRLEQNTSTNK